MTAGATLQTLGVIDPGANVLLEVIRAASPIEAVRRMEEKMRGPDYVATRQYEEGSEDSLDGADQAYLVYALDGSGLDAEGWAARMQAPCGQRPLWPRLLLLRSAKTG